MILLESTPESPFKSPIPRNEHDSDSQPVEVDVPPAYGQQPPHSPNSTSPLLSRVKDGQSSNWRFLKAFFVAALILSALVASTFKIIYFARSRHLPRQIQNPNHNIKGWPESSDGIAERCVGGRDWEPYSSPDWALFPYRSRNTFRLPVALNALGIFSRGSFSIGVISVLDSEDGGDHIEVEVLTSYSSQEALDRASVCLLRREDGGKGIGIFTPKHWGNVAQKDLLLFNITVYLPVRHSHIYVNSFETDLPLFVHNFGDLAKTVNFRRLSLKGSQAPMNVKSLSAEYASVTNSEEQIVGSFNVSTSLNLHTNRHVIEAQISLSNDPSGRATTLNMTTSKAYIDSTISLISTNSTGGSFNVSAKTSDNPLRIHYETSPLNSILHHHSESSSSPVSVKLDSAYEGSFTLQSSNISPSVEKKDVKDPSGMHRYRWLDVFHIRGDYLTGDVFWNAWKWPNPVESKGRGVVNIKTSNSPARLYL